MESSSSSSSRASSPSTAINVDTTSLNSANGSVFSALNRTQRPPLPDAVALLPSAGDHLKIAAIYPISLFLASFSTVLFTPQPTYFSLKRNIFNIFFVKYGWLWTTLIYAYHATRLRRTRPLQAVLRWALATAWWVLVTQWCFGPPLMDRMFLLTGGLCEVINDPNTVDESQLTTPELLVTSAACKLAKGHWKGGHDLSGHVFMLTHASLFLWSELMPTLQMGNAKQWTHSATWAVGALLGLWWWMLVMTGVHFHTWREKITGLLASVVQWIVVYMVGIRLFPQVRAIIGVPSL